MAEKMWDGRFSKSTDKNVNDFNSSISFDCRMYAHDIRGSIAHARMLAKKEIISQDEMNLIVSGLIEIQKDIDTGTLMFDSNAEDIHMFIESELTKRIGQAGKKLHTGRSRNDQVALDIKLYAADEIKNIYILLEKLTHVMISMAENNLDTVMPGYTHLQRAQPVTFAHHIMAYVQMLLRDISRLSDCKKRMMTMPLGSGALAGTTYDLDREYVSDELGFLNPTENSLDGVSDRDHVIELISCLSIIMVHLSRLSEEIILWASKEFSFIELDDAFSTGSSIMPQKKNPDVAELTRGKSGRVFGDLITILTVMKGLPLAYNKDMQEDKQCLFDAIDTVKSCLVPFTGMLETMKLNKMMMQDAAEGGFTNATDLADYLVKKGMPFRDAHEISGKLVKYCLDNKTDLISLDLQEYKKYSSLISDDIYQSISLDTCVNERKITGGPAVHAVKKSIETAKYELGKFAF